MPEYVPFTGQPLPEKRKPSKTTKEPEFELNDRYKQIWPPTEVENSQIHHCIYRDKVKFCKPSAILLKSAYSNPQWFSLNSKYV
jgi:hypothetical protein